MEDAAQAALPFLAQDAERVVVGLARVNHDRQVAARSASANLGAKHLVLHLARREVVVIVEADLADRARRRQRVEARRAPVGRRLADRPANALA